MAEIVSAKNVAVGKPNLQVSGGFMFAPLGTARPTDASTPLDAAYVSTGYVGEDGVSLSVERDTNDIPAWGGTKVRTVQTSYAVTMTVSLIESKNLDTLKYVYGDDNVSLETGTIVVRGNEKVLPHKQIVIDMLDGEDARRIDIGYGQVTEVGEISYVDGDAIAYELTISCDPDDARNNFTEFIEVGGGALGE